MLGVHHADFAVCRLKNVEQNLFQAILLFILFDYQPTQIDDYVFPTWADTLGWVILASCIICVPIMAIWQVFCVMVKEEKMVW